MEYKTNPWTIGLAVIVTVVVVGGGIFLWQNRNAETAPDITSTRVVSEKTVERTETKVECPQNWTMYESQNLSFCYNNSWGTPKFTDETHKDGIGKLFKIGFANEKYTSVDNAPSTPQLWWETKDFAPAAADYSTTCFECINFNQSESEIIKALGYENKNATAQKVSVNGKNALRVKTDYFEKMFDQGQISRLEYFVPNAFGDYHLQAVVSYSKADGLDTLMKDISFKEQKN
ncbi:MAG: hypothetical protein UY92_C0014G0042 [Candidatus Magasanikbacteria bacterium GW2011_GWA2_56_11]|uniref:Uncharacterized protein n=1 Tax=Candidatus Magasanikbacteria bacterium GW2011_GWA2_56_11 TaxID=1619044 RepID=A0A0G2AKF6_9BACT|nr:MAG: hypothetical protein UY92_C0014G0042 [Candidatus Magasanikbacteria bacterium GW2011_GWA2_56_11]